MNDLAPESDLPSIADLSDIEVVEAVAGWFHSNYEDPVHHAPYNGREGGYFYIHGGPYEARDVLDAAFGSKISDDALDQAVEEIEADGTDEWGPASWRHLLPNDEEWKPVQFDSATLHGEMLELLHNVESEFFSGKLRPVGMGHNNPPSDLLGLTLDDEETRQFREAIAIVKQQPPNLSTVSLVLSDAAKTIQHVSNTCQAAIAKLGDPFLEGIAKGAGEEIGKRAIQAGLLAALANALIAWLKSLGA